MKSQPRSYEILLSEGPKKTYQEIREELDQKHRVMQDTHQKIIFNRKENLKKNIEEVQEIQKIYTYGYRKNVKLHTYINFKIKLKYFSYRAVQMFKKQILIFQIVQEV